ncbi:MAG: DUF2807 domain-containing protein [Verrucomicrobia bacterium]|nr:DUF2807 domain-containing protein [Verrucomicrobiota bacterium]
MKKLILAQLALLALAGCDSGSLHGNGHFTTEQRTVTPFTNVDITDSFNVEWRPGPASASLTLEDNLKDYVEIRVDGNTLHASTTRSLWPSHPMKLVLTSQSLDGASFSGATKFNAHQLTGGRFAVETSGASRVTLDGSVGTLVASLTGASDLRAEKLQAKTAEISVTGAGDARVNVSDTLKVSITGAGKVEYTGNPAHVEREITGAGSIKKRD